MVTLDDLLWKLQVYDDSVILDRIEIDHAADRVTVTIREYENAEPITETL